MSSSSQELSVITKHEKALSPLFHQLNIMENSVAKIIELLPKMHDDQLINVVEYSQRLGNGAWLLRGAATLEIRKRAETRQVGGRGKKDTEGTGVKAQIGSLAAKIGVNPRTLEADAQIVDRFFSDEGDNVKEVFDDTLDRGHYIQALRAPEPEEAIRIAKEKSTRGNYTPQQMKQDVDVLRGAAEAAGAATKTKTVDAETGAVTEETTAPPVTTPDIENSWWLNVPISIESRDKFHGITKRLGLSNVELVERMVDMADTTFDTADTSIIPVRTQVLSRLRDTLCDLEVNVDDWSISDCIEYVIALAVKGKKEEAAQNFVIPGSTVAELVVNEDFLRLAPVTTLAEMCSYCPDVSETTVRTAWRQAKRGEV